MSQGHPRNPAASPTATLARVTPPLHAIVSPYHLTTREPAAIVASQLADSMTTLLLAPRDDRRAGVRQAAIHSPVYRSFMRSWEWAMPLFDEGLMSSIFTGLDPAEDVRDACRRLFEEPAFAPLTPYLRSEVFEDESLYLRAASLDVLKAGPDPAVSVPIAAGLDRFAADTGTVVIRSAAASVVQKHEARLGRTRFRVTIPVIRQGSAERLLLARALTEDTRASLASAIMETFDGHEPARVCAAAGSYAHAFNAELEDLTAAPGPRDADEVRVIVGEASLEGMDLPVDASLHASVTAATGQARSHPIHADTPRVRTLLIRSVGCR